MRRLGWILFFLVLGYGGYIAFRIGVIYFERWSVQRMLEHTAKQAVHPVHKDTVRAYINAQVRDHRFPFSPDEVRVEEFLDESVKVSVSYSRTLTIIPENFILPPWHLNFIFNLYATARPREAS